jgi:hypothetical protein
MTNCESERGAIRESYPISTKVSLTPGVMMSWSSIENVKKLEFL